MEKKLSIVKDLNKLFSLREGEDTKINPEEYKGYMDASNVCMLVPKTREFEKVLLFNFNVTESKIPLLDYISPLESKAVFGTEYLAILLQLCRHYDKVTLCVKHDFPLMAETEDFIFILAPRVDR